MMKIQNNINFCGNTPKMQLKRSYITNKGMKPTPFLLSKNGNSNFFQKIINFFFKPTISKANDKNNLMTTIKMFGKTIIEEFKHKKQTTTHINIYNKKGNRVRSRKLINGIIYMENRFNPHTGAIKSMRFFNKLGELESENFMITKPNGKHEQKQIRYPRDYNKLAKKYNND